MKTKKNKWCSILVLVRAQKHKLLFLIAFWVSSFSLNSQNLLNTNTWTVGTGSVSGFSKNGDESENSRELGKNHIGEEVVLWKAKPSGNGYPDGGWNTGWLRASSGKSYRFSIWIKKTNSNSGSTYFGFYANSSGSLRLSGSYNSNPYFWYGDLPELNKWYLLVGYVHKSGYTGTTNTGGIYDGTTGEKVRTITDYKLKSSVTALIHRSYLYYDPNTADRQYFYKPRIDVINGNEPNIRELLSINNNSKVVFSFDTAGNQKQHFYCPDPSDCNPPSGRAKVAEKKEEQAITDTQNNNLEENTANQILDNHFSMYPNPTADFITLNIGQNLLKNIHSIKLFTINSKLVKSIKPQGNLQVDLSQLSSGVYVIHIHLREGHSITKKIIKN